MFADDAEGSRLSAILIAATRRLADALRAHYHPVTPFRSELLKRYEAMNKTVPDELARDFRNRFLTYVVESDPAQLVAEFPDDPRIGAAAGDFRAAALTLRAHASRNGSAGEAAEAERRRRHAERLRERHGTERRVMGVLYDWPDPHGDHRVPIAHVVRETGLPEAEVVRVAEQLAELREAAYQPTSSVGSCVHLKPAGRARYEAELAAGPPAATTDASSSPDPDAPVPTGEALPADPAAQPGVLLGVYVKAQGSGLHVSVDDAAREVGMDPDDALEAATALSRAEIRPQVKWLRFLNENPVVVDNEGGHVALSRSARRWCADRWGPPAEAAKAAERLREGAKSPTDATTERVPTHTFLTHAAASAAAPAPGAPENAATAVVPGGAQAGGTGAEEGSAGTLPPEAAAAPPSARRGRYIVVAELGDGGMGRVVKAWDPLLALWVALKFMKPTAEPARQLREARAVMRLKNDGVARVLGLEKAGGERFIVMEFVEGVPIDEIPRCRERVRTLVRLARDLADVLDHAHTQGVFHRDVKPRNVLVERADDDERAAVRLLDFGLAQIVGEEDGQTTTGVVLGSLEYMAPEQANAGTKDARTDVHGIGATLYRCLTGRPPFHGANRVETLAQAATQDPSPIRPDNPGVSPELERVVLRCLAKDPGERFQSARKLADALDTFLTEDALATPGTLALAAAAPIQTPTPPPTAPESGPRAAAPVDGRALTGQELRAAAADLASRVLEQTSAKLGLPSGAARYWLQLRPTRPWRVAGFHRGDTDSAHEAMRGWTPVRRAGFGWGGEPVAGPGGELLTSLIGSQVLSLHRSGLVTSMCGQDTLCHGTPSTDREHVWVNPWALVEFTLEACRFIRQVVFPHSATNPSLEWRCGMAEIEGEVAVLLREGPPQHSPIRWATDGATPAADFLTEWRGNVTPDPGALALAVLREVYGRFALGEKFIPFVKDGAVSSSLLCEAHG